MSLVLLHTLVDCLTLVLHSQLQSSRVCGLTCHITLTNVDHGALCLRVIVRREVGFSLRVKHQVVTQRRDSHTFRLYAPQFLRNEEKYAAYLFYLFSEFLIVDLIDLLIDLLLIKAFVVIFGGRRAIILVETLQKFKAIINLVTLFDRLEHFNQLLL